jgi:hypothetical protein
MSCLLYETKIVIKKEIKNYYFEREKISLGNQIFSGKLSRFSLRNAAFYYFAIMTKSIISVLF